MKYLLLLLHLIFFSPIYGQVSIGLSKAGDVVDIGKKHSVPWETKNAQSSGFWLTYPVKHIELGTSVIFGNFTLRRPGYQYRINYTTFGFSISQSRYIWRQFRTELKLLPYLRYFEDELYTASLIVDGINYGFGLNCALHYNFYKNLDVGIGVKREWDLLRSAINSDEIIQKDRFVKI
jgi:hypothetical protein